jgi:hypothetical protein
MSRIRHAVALVLFLGVSLVLIAPGLVVQARAQGGVALLPDLVPDKPERLLFEYDSQQTDASRMLLRFDSFIHNAGPGVLEIFAQKPKEENGKVVMTDVVQRAYSSPAPVGKPIELKSTPAPTVVYEENDDHNHFHLKDATRYSLVSASLVDGQGRSTIPFAKSQAGFCLADYERVDPAAGDPHYGVTYEDFCSPGNPWARSVTMGVMPGWRDVYQRELAFQWIDVSDVQPGEYAVRSEPDPTGVITEANEANNQGGAEAETPAIVPGYVARGQTVRAVGLGPTPITLGADRFASKTEGAKEVGSSEFRIVTPPSHGSLGLRSDSWSDDAVLLYQPDSGYRGVDHFTFAARDRDNPAFPRTPREATVDLIVGP